MTDEDTNACWQGIAAANGVIAIMYNVINKKGIETVTGAVPKVIVTEAYVPQPAAQTYARKK